MKFKFLNTVLVSLIIIVSSMTTAYASLITINDAIEVEALTLDEDFVSFYDYNSTNKWSSNTGYEQNNTIVMFFAEYNDDLALFTLTDSYGAGNAGTATISIENIDDFGSIIFKDDANDVITADGVSWAWIKKKNDGFIFQLTDPNNFYLDINFSDLTGLANGIKFLSFSDINSPTEYVMDESLTAKVPEPSTIAIFAFGVMGLAVRRFKR